MARIITIDYCPRKAFHPLHRRKERWSVVVAHRRAGKTVACINELIKSAVKTTRKDSRYAYIAPYYRQAKDVAWDYLKRFSAPIPGIKINEGELRIDYPNGSRIQLYGADNADALRGLYFDGVVADEFGDWRPSVWQYVVRPALADRQGWAIIIGTPRGHNEFYERSEHAKYNSDWLLITIKSSASGILPESEMQAMRSEMSDEAWRQEMECDFDAAILGAIYGKELYELEQSGRSCSVPYDDSVPVHTAWDLGYKDDTAIWWHQVVRGEVHVLDYYGASGLKMDDYFTEIRSRQYKYGYHYFPHDAKAKTLASGGKSIEEMAWSALGIDKVRIVPSLSLQDGIQAARVMLRTTWFDKINCNSGINALKQYQRKYDELKKAFADKPIHDWTSHAADAFRMLAVAYQEEITPKEAKPPRWAQELTINEMIKEHKRRKYADE